MKRSKHVNCNKYLEKKTFIAPTARSLHSYDIANNFNKYFFSDRESVKKLKIFT